ncbi:MAG: acyl-CoA thioesterase [Deltaproteobacteria bacterium]|nr:acyl-CoA thioesterase [Deltaproteobacteria bacterium]
MDLPKNLGLTYTTTRPVRFADVDAAGWLYYPRFFEFCHNAFEDWVNEKGPVSYAQMVTKERWGFPAVKACGDYKAPLKHGDIAEISFKIEHIGKASLITAYQIIRQSDQTLSFTGQITTVCVDLKAAKSMPIPDAMREFLG